MVDKLISAYEKLSDWIEDLLKWFCLAMFILMVTIVLLGILSRFTGLFYVLWSEEVGRYLMIWMGFFGAVMALRRGQHIGIVFLIQKIPRSLQNISSLFVKALILYFLTYMLREGIGLMKIVARTEQVSPMGDIPLHLVYAIIPLTGALMIFQVVLLIVQQIRKIGRRIKA
jgi:TRAP-type C4-dicarboxylate transport system permease small subunit